MRVTKIIAGVTMLLGMTLSAVRASAVMLVNDKVGDRVLQYDVDGTAFTYGGVFAQGTLAGVSLDMPWGMTIGADGWVYVGEGKNGGRILRFAQDGTFINVVATGNSGGFLSRPESIEVGPDGSIYVSDSFGSTTSDCVHKIDVSGPTSVTSVFIPQSGAGYSLANPRGLSFGPDGNAYVSDRDNKLIRKFDGSTGTFVENFATTPNQPHDLLWEGGELYVSKGSGIWRYNADGTFNDTFLEGTVGYNIGLAANEGEIYTASYGDGKIVRRTGPASSVQVAPAGSETLSQPGHALFFDAQAVAALEAVADTYIDDSNADTNFGSNSLLRVEKTGGHD